jgi:hypothetical protein
MTWFSPPGDRRCDPASFVRSMFDGRAFPSQPATPGFQRGEGHCPKNAPIVQEYFAVRSTTTRLISPRLKPGALRLILVRFARLPSTCQGWLIFTSVRKEAARLWSWLVERHATVRQQGGRWPTRNQVSWRRPGSPGDTGQVAPGPRARWVGPLCPSRAGRVDPVRQRSRTT